MKILLFLLFPILAYSQDSIVFNLGASQVTIYKDGHQKRVPSTSGNSGKYLTGLANYTTANLSDLTNAGTARTNLGLGSLATQSGTFSGTSSGTNTGDQTLNSLLPTQTGNSGKYLTTDGSNTSWGSLAGGGDMLKSDNLSGLSNYTTARSNLGLGSLATQSGTFSGTSSGTNTGDQTTVSGNAGTATVLQTGRTINGVSFDGSANITAPGDNEDMMGYAALGSPFLAQTIGVPIQTANTSSALVDNQVRFCAVYLPLAKTLTGIRVYVRTLGNYTGDNNNRVGLYSYSGGTLTLVASSANSSSLWTSAANAFQTIAFSSTYAASAGIYFVGLLYNNSAQTTAPTLASGVALNNAAMATLGFTNSAKLYATLAAQNDLPSSQASSGLTATTITQWIALY